MEPSDRIEQDLRHRLALQAAELGLWVWDARADTIDWDERTREILGVWPAAITPAVYDAAIHPDDMASKQAAWAAALLPGGNGAYVADYRLERPDTGQTLWLTSCGRTVFEHGQPVRMIGVLRDVTALRQSELRLQRVAEQMAGIVSIAADAIITVDAQQHITLFNHGAEMIFGYARDEMMGQPLSMLLPPEYRERHHSHITTFGTSGVTARRMGERREVRGRRKSGEVFFADASISKLDVGGERIFTVVLRDVTERREAARLIEHSNQTLELALDAGQIGLFEHDHASGRVFWSPRLRAMLGLGDADPASLALYLSLVPEEARGGVADVLAQATAADASSEVFVEHPLLGRDGVRRWLSVRSHTSFLDGRPERTVGAVHDVTARKQTQALLEYEVEARTRELHEEMRRREQSQAQLLRTQRMEAFGQLTGGIAHDFNNLLTVITGNLELLEMRIKDDKARVLLARAQEAAEMGARLTGRLLTFARRRQFEAAALNLNEVVMGMAELLERTLGEPITLTTVLERNPWTVLVDASEIENAILNLAINARDAMPIGGRLVIETGNVAVGDSEIGGATRLPAGEYVRLSISDTGIGMSQNVLQKAFEPFFTTKEPGKGTGLGLSTIYGFVHEARGTVTIYSEVGRGTTVNVYLPRIDQPFPAPQPDEAGRDIAGAGERVLLVEDNPGVRLATRSQLEILGYAVTDVANGPAAVEVLNTSARFDVVFSDVVMGGGMSGFDVAHWVRMHASSSRMLLASGYPDEVLRTQAPDGPKTEILRKPYSRRELGLALRRVLAT